MIKQKNNNFKLLLNYLNSINNDLSSFNKSLYVDHIRIYLKDKKFIDVNKINNPEKRTIILIDSKIKKDNTMMFKEYYNKKYHQFNNIMDLINYLKTSNNFINFTVNTKNFKEVFNKYNLRSYYDNLIINLSSGSYIKLNLLDNTVTYKSDYNIITSLITDDYKRISKILDDILEKNFIFVEGRNIYLKNYCLY